MTVLLLVVASVLSLVVAAFCAGAETAFLSVNRGRVVHLAREGGRKAKIVEKAISEMGRTTTVLLIGNNLASVAYSSATAALTVKLCEQNVTATALCSFTAAFLVLYFAEFMPKLTCAARPLRHVLGFALAYQTLNRLIRPLTDLAMAFTGLFMSGKDEKPRLTSDDILRILQDRKDGVCLSDIESALISRIISQRIKGRQITSEVILSALADPDAS